MRGDADERGSGQARPSATVAGLSAVIVSAGVVVGAAVAWMSRVAGVVALGEIGGERWWEKKAMKAVKAVKR